MQAMAVTEQTVMQTVMQLMQGKRGVQLAKTLMAYYPTSMPRETDATDMSGLVALHARSQFQEKQGEFGDAFDARHKAIQLLIPARTTGILSPGTNFLLPVLKQFLLHLRDLALKADKDSGGTEDKGSTFQGKCLHMGWYGVESLNHGAVCSILKSLYSDILNDDERNFACITIYTVGWQCAAQLNSTTVVSRWTLPDYQYKLPDRVTKEYYRGLVQFGNNKWSLAVEHLSFAFRHIPKKTYQGHVQCVLWRLLVARMHACLSPKGGLGSPQLFHEFAMPQLGELSTAFGRGDVRTFEKNLETHQDLYVKKEVLMQLYKLRMLLYRNLFKRAYVVIKTVRGQANRITLQDLHAVAVKAGWDVDQDEMECILATLIAQGYIKGKLDPGRDAVMMSKSRPFPRDGA